LGEGSGKWRDAVGGGREARRPEESVRPRNRLPHHAVQSRGVVLSWERCRMLPFRNQWCVLVVLPAVLLAGSAAGQPAEGDKRAVVYSSNFEQTVGAEWSSRKTGVTPKAGRRFLGPFANDQVSLTLKGLPRHACVCVSFGLFVMMTWDGGDLRDPDIWNLRVKGGPKLIHCTFATARGEQGAQTFPDNLPGPLHPGRTGAAEKLTLGYAWSGRPLDAVYRLRPVFAHTGRELTLVFSGSALQEVADESWGLDNLKVELLSGPQPLEKRELGHCWQALVGADPPKAFEALWRLVLAGDQAADAAAARGGDAAASANGPGRLRDTCCHAQRWGQPGGPGTNREAAGRVRRSAVRTD
jgi:hypothetical protein